MFMESSPFLVDSGVSSVDVDDNGFHNLLDDVGRVAEDVVAMDDHNLSLLSG